jgi:hypothetical protein
MSSQILVDSKQKNELKHKQNKKTKKLKKLSKLKN